LNDSALPTACPVCRLPLISAPHLARSYHHLFPPPDSIPFIPQNRDSTQNEQNSKLNLEKEEKLFKEITACCGCGDLPEDLDQGKLFVYCSKCHSSLCQLCDMFVDDNIHSCPGCS
jgi:transcription initiation factor TFIIH subunit 2